VKDYQLNMAMPSAQITAATQYSPPSLDGSVSANGDGGAGFAIFAQGTLWVTDASPAGHGVELCMGRAA